MSKSKTRRSIVYRSNGHKTRFYKIELDGEIPISYIEIDLEESPDRVTISHGGRLWVNLNILKPIKKAEFTEAYKLALDQIKSFYQ